VYQEKSDAYTHIVRGPGNLFITQLSQDTSGVAEANAHLMAAAPEMLEALMELREACAACFRIIAQEPGLATKLDEEFQRIGLNPGFGVRAQDVVRKVTEAA